MSSSPSGPRTRQRLHKPPPELTVPDIHVNAAERKRALSVLAQRRYRERKRRARLAAQATEAAQASESSAQASAAPDSGGPPCTPDASAVGDVIDEATSPSLLNTSDSSTQSPAPTQAPFEIPQLDFTQDSLCWFPPDEPLTNPDPTLLSLQPPDLNQALLFPLSTPATTSLAHLTTSTPTPHPPSTTTPPLTLPSPSPDSYHLPVPPLTLLRALLRIAARLNAASSVWSLTAASPFTLGCAPPPADLPPAWRPTETQLAVPHHPVLDLLPWGGVRDRVIGVLDAGLGGRVGDGRGGDGQGHGGGAGGGEGATGTGSGLVDFIYDMEDAAEGIRVHGPDPFDEEGWEVGQVVFERWWFVFDRGVVARSNRRRRERGAPALRVVSLGG